MSQGDPRTPDPMDERTYHGKRRAYCGYPLPLIIKGVLAIQRRKRLACWNRGLEPTRAEITHASQDDVFWYLVVQGFNSGAEFRDFLASRTSARYAERLLNGSLIGVWDRRARKERMNGHHQDL